MWLQNPFPHLKQPLLMEAIDALGLVHESRVPLEAKTIGYHAQCRVIMPIMTHTHIILTHWGQQTHICVGNLANIGSDDGLPPVRCQGIVWTNAAILLIGPLGTNFSEIWIGIQTFSLKKSIRKCRLRNGVRFCLCLNVWMQLPFYSTKV